MILTLGVGYVVGVNGIRGFWLIVLSLAFMFIQQAILFLSPAVDGLIRIGETGAGGFDASQIIVVHMVFHPALLICAIFLGRGILRSQVSQLQAEAERLSAEQLVSQLNVMAGHPQLSAAGWMSDRWNNMTDEVKLSWTTSRQARIRQLWLTFGGEGFEAAGTDLPMLLAKIDIE